MYTLSKRFGMVKSRHYRAWIERNLQTVIDELDKVEIFPIEIEIQVVEGYGFHSRADISNINKACVDLLVRAKIIPDDNSKYVTRCEEKFIPFWTKKSEAITTITVLEPDQNSP